MNVRTPEEFARIQEDIMRIRTRLKEYYANRYDIDLWIKSRHKLLDGRRPCDLINDGKAAEVERLLDQLDHGVHI